MSRISKAAQREREALQLRREGHSFDAIAEQLGYANKGSAHKAWKRALDRAGTADSTPAEHRLLELDRLEELYRALWPAASRGDLGAVRECARLHDKKVRLLGLGIPARSGLSDGGDHDGPSRQGVVVGQDVLEELRERRERAASERSSGS